MKRKLINYSEFTEDLINEIIESFHSTKSGRDYLREIKILTAKPGSNGKREYIPLVKIKSDGTRDVITENLDLAIRNKKLPGETEEEFRNKILKSLEISYSKYGINKKGARIIEKTDIKGKDWEEIRNEQIKVPTIERRPIGSISGNIKNIKKQISKTELERSLVRIKNQHKNVLTSINNGFVSGINPDFDKLKKFINTIIKNMSDIEFDDMFKERTNNFYKNIFSSNDEQMHSSYIELVKDVLKTSVGKRYKNNISKNNSLYKYLNDDKLLEELIDSYINQAEGIRSTPIKLRPTIN